MAATTWDYFKTDDSDYGFYLDLIARGEGRVLDVVCATERLLIPYLKAGIDIEGVDSSEEMLSICRDKAARRGLAPVLYRQRMEALDLPHKYTTLIVPGGSFQFVTDREEAHLNVAPVSCTSQAGWQFCDLARRPGRRDVRGLARTVAPVGGRVSTLRRRRPEARSHASKCRSRRADVKDDAAVHREPAWSEGRGRGPHHANASLFPRMRYGSRWKLLD